VDVSTRRRSRRPTQLPRIEMSKTQLDDDDGDDEVVLSGSSWEERLSELADYRKIHGHCNIPANTVKTSSWVIGSQSKRGITSCTEKELNRL
jgi:hypothetical protein